MSIFQKKVAPITINTTTDKQFKMQFHSHMNYEIYYFREGSCNYLIGDKIHILIPGDVIIMHGMTLHSPNVDPKADYCRTIVHFNPSYIEGMMQHPYTMNVLKPFQELRNHKLQLTKAEHEQFKNKLEQVEQLYKQDDILAFHRFHANFLDLLFLIYGYCQKPLELKNKFPSAKEHHVQNVITFVEENYHQDIRLEEMEMKLHLSKYYLVKLFKEVTGMTIFTYLYQRRINQAKILFLLEKDMNITEVCYLIGFKHPSHFSRIFKRLVGSTPEQYRKSTIH